MASYSPGPIAPAPGLGTAPGDGGNASPPGLWQPPGLGGTPMAPSPPPALATPAGLTATAASVVAATAGAFDAGADREVRELELQKEISGTIGIQVSQLIEKARHDTESKVKVELTSIRGTMMAMDQRLDQLLVQLDGIEPQEPLEAPLDADEVGQLLSKIEQQWGQEIRTLKQELHQTILAHNHNADLIKHQKITIDDLRERCVKLQGNSMKTSEIQQQVQRLDTRLKTHQQKQRKLEPLCDRITSLEQRMTTAAQVAGMRYFMSPGMSGPPGIPPAMMPGLARRG